MTPKRRQDSLYPPCTLLITTVCVCVLTPATNVTIGCDMRLARFHPRNNFGMPRLSSTRTENDPSRFHPNNLRILRGSQQTSLVHGLCLSTVASIRCGGGFIEANPDHEEDESLDSHIEEDLEEDDESSKEGIHHISRSDTKRLLIRRRRRRFRVNLLNQIQKKQLTFYLLLTLFAFRKDIFEFIIQYNIIPTRLDPDTGRRRLHIKWTTDGLKLLLIAQIIRSFVVPSIRHQDVRVLSQERNDQGKRMANETEHHPTEDSDGMVPRRKIPLLPIIFLLLLLLMGKNNLSFLLSHPFLLPVITSFVLRSLRSSDPSSLISQILSLGTRQEMAIHQAHIPNVEQHYSFEQLNERYYRDWAAWRKSLPTNHALVPAHFGDPGDVVNRRYGSTSDDAPHHWGKLSTIISSLLHPGEYSASKPAKSTIAPAHSLVNTYPRDYSNGTVIVMDMTKLDTQASRMESIRDQISFVIHLAQYEHPSFFSQDVEATDTFLNTATTISSTPESNATFNSTYYDNAPPPKKLEIIVLLESPGGSVSSYGLASSHLQRLRSTPGIKLTVCIDTVAASGGYMMACMSSPGQLYCAPFAMVGSIGVIGQSLNIQKTLEKYGVRPYVFRGGRMKNPVGVVGDVTKEGVEAMQEMVDRIHDAFRQHVAEAREGALVEALKPLPNNKYFQLGDSDCAGGVMSVIDQVATGDVFLGIQAHKLGLVDRLITSDEYIFERIQQGARVLRLIVNHKSASLSQLFFGYPPHHKNSLMSESAEAAFLKTFWSKLQERLKI